MHIPRILIVGSINMDLCMYNVDGMPKIGASSFCSDYEYAEGGKGSNQAFAAARLGAEAVMVGRVGSGDSNGQKLLASMEKAGVHTDFIVRDEKHRTGMSIMSILQEGKYYSIYAKGANDYISPEDVKAALDDNVYDMLLMQLEMPLETVYRSYEMAKERNIPVFLDAGPAMNIPLDRLRGVTVISPNEVETEALTGIKADDDCGARKAAYQLYQEVAPKYVIIKLGKRGVLFYDGKEAKRIPAFPVDAVDTTAAGDTFGAAFAIQYCMGKTAEKAIDFAQAAAALCVTRKGGHASIPTIQEVERFLEKTGGVPELC